MKKIAIVPTLCTLANAACGYAAILLALRANIVSDLTAEQAARLSGWLIFAAMVFDMLDGYLARRVKSASPFGAELDSLCDAISFGVAPGLLIVQLGESIERRFINEVFPVVGALYMICAILRLARFNVQTTLDPKSHRYFRGLPSPAAAGCIASLVVLRYSFTNPRVLPAELVHPLIHWLAPLAGLAVALLMVSRIPYLHVANQLLHRRHPFSRVVQVILAVFAIALFRESALVIVFWIYALAGPARVAWHRARRREIPPIVREP